MNKTLLKIFICTLILLIGIGAVSAIEQNSTDEFLSFEQNHDIAINEDTEVLSVENNNTEVITVSNDNGEVLRNEENNEVIGLNEDTEVLSVENNNTEVITVSDDNGEVLSVENRCVELISVNNETNNVLSSKIIDEKLSDISYTSYRASNGDDVIIRVETNHFFIAKMKFPKKYKKFVKGYKPSKKNKKAWKKYKVYKKIEKKQLKKYKKIGKKKLRKLIRNHWYVNTLDPIIKLKYTKKYMYIKVYVYADRAYDYNPSTGQGWWEENVF